MLITIYLIKNPDGVVMSAFSDEKAAEHAREEKFINLGGAWSVEPCSLRVGKELIERIKTLKKDQD